MSPTRSPMAASSRSRSRTPASFGADSTPTPYLDDVQSVADYAIVWAGKTRNRLAENGRLELPEDMKVRILRDAARIGWSAHHLPPVSHMIDVCIDTANVPINIGYPLFEICLGKLLNFIKSWVTPGKLGPGLVLQNGTAAWSQELRDFIHNRNFTMEDVKKNGMPNRISRNSVMKTPTWEPMKRTELARQVMSTLVKQNALYDDEGTPPNHSTVFLSTEPSSTCSTTAATAITPTHPGPSRSRHTRSVSRLDDVLPYVEELRARPKMTDDKANRKLFNKFGMTLEDVLKGGNSDTDTDADSDDSDYDEDSCDSAT